MVIKTGSREKVAAGKRMKAIYVIWDLIISFILFLLPFDLLYFLELFDDDEPLYFVSPRFMSFDCVIQYI